MKGIEMTVKGNKLVLELDLNGDYGLSKSGKTVIVASTAGSATVPGTDIKLSLTAYKKPTA